MMIAPLLVALLGSFAAAQTTTDELQVSGQVGVSFEAPQARLEARMRASDAYALKVSSPTGEVLFLLDRRGRAGVGLADPAAVLDASGTANSSDIGLQLRVGNSSSSQSSSQMVFALMSSDTLRHSIRSRHAEGQNLGNALDFFLWRSTNAPSDLGQDWVLSLEASPALSSGSVHVHPAGTPAAELVVSNGVAAGAGTIHRLESYTPSLKVLKRDIHRLGEETAAAAYAQLRGLRHASFSYLGEEGRRHRGLIFEEAPASLQGPGQTLDVNERVAQVEIVLQEIHRRIDLLERDVSAAEAGRR